MENLTIDQARRAIVDYLGTEKLPEVVLQSMGVVGVGLCLAQRDPVAYGVRVNVSNNQHRQEILSYFPGNLHDNVVIEVVGEVRAEA